MTLCRASDTVPTPLPLPQVGELEDAIILSQILYIVKDNLKLRRCYALMRNRVKSVLGKRGRMCSDFDGGPLPGSKAQHAEEAAEKLVRQNAEPDAGDAEVQHIAEEIGYAGPDDHD